MSGPRVGLFGILGAGNLGNDASMESVLTYLRARHPEAVVDAMCKGPDTVTRRYGIPAVALTWYQRHEETATGVRSAVLKLAGKLVDVFRTAAWVRRHDAVIVPGMGVMEATLPLKALHLPYSLLLLSWWGRVFGTKVALVGVGAAPIKRRTTRMLLDGAARWASYRSYRDVPSLEAMRARGLDTSRDRVHADVAFALPMPACGPGDPRIVGLGVMEYHGGDADRARAAEIRSAYLATMKRFVLWLLDHDRCVRLLVADENEPERTAAAEILTDVRAARPRLTPDRLSLHQASSFAELMDELAPIGTVVATRYHTMICALRLGKPVIALGYAPKFAAILSAMGLADFHQSARSPDADRLVAQFLELEQRQGDLRTAIAAGNASFEQRAEEQFAELSAALFAGSVRR